LSPGRKLLAVDETPARTWSEASTAVLEAALYRRDATVSVREADGDDRRLVLALSKLPRSLDDRALPAAISLALQQPAVVGQVLAGDPAARAGLQTGDVLLAINQQAVSDFNDFYELLQDAAGRDPNLHLQLRRGQQTLAVDVIAKTVVNDDGSTGFRIGIGAQPPKRDAVLRYGPLAALPAALAETWTTTTKTLVIASAVATALAGLAQTATAFFIGASFAFEADQVKPSTWEIFPGFEGDLSWHPYARAWLMPWSPVGLLRAPKRAMSKPFRAWHATTTAARHC